jgi:hypothetical protein
MELNLEWGEGVPHLCCTWESGPAKEKRSVRSLGGEAAVGSPLPPEYVRASPQGHIPQLDPQSEELDDGIHRELACNVPHPRCIKHAMLHRACPPDARPDKLDQIRRNCTNSEPLDPRVLPEEGSATIANGHTHRCVEDRCGVWGNLEANTGPWLVCIGFLKPQPASPKRCVELLEIKET